ncbi:hypothetical protein [Mesorhizobium sp. M0060]|uniref:hypothetical protein n=1 Tax=Mesorhizobium sp. M0060 TaxID=2956866 RepID=UPI0033387256
MTMVDWSAVAYHEAGHAVAYILFNRRVFGDDPEFPAFESVHIDNIRGPGFVKGNFLYSTREYTGIAGDIDMARRIERDWAIWEIIACLAGPFAEAAFDGYHDPFDMAMEANDMNEGSSDYVEAERVYSDLNFLMSRRPDWGNIEDRTARLVRECWPAIEALAARLLVKHDLQFDEALEIVVPHLPTPPERALPPLA